MIEITMTSSAPTLGEPVSIDRATRIRKFLVGAGPLIALIVLAVFFAIASPTFSTPGNISILLTQLSILMVIGLGLTFVILLGSIDLSVEGVMASSSLVFVLFATNDRNDFQFGLLAVLAGILTGSLFGLINGVLHVKLGIPSFMVTLGMGAVGIGVATVLFGGRAPRLLDEGLRVWGLGSTAGISNLVFIAAAVLAIGFVIQRFTRVGRYGYVIGGDEPIAKLSGINIGKYKILSFVVSGTAAGIAGVMAATQLGVGDSTIGSGLLFTAITAVVLGGTLLVGGRGGVIQTLIGVGIITVLANGLILIGVDPYIQQAVQGLVIVIAVIASGWSLRRRVRVIK
jgi:ribose transport system permease protein